MEHVQVDWLHEDRVLEVTMVGKVSDDDFLEFDRHIADIINQSSAEQVHVIFNNSELTGIPSVTTYKDLTFTKLPQLGWGVSHSDSDLTRFFMNTFRQMNWIYFHVCTSIDDCVNFLNDMDFSLEFELPPSYA